VSDDASLTMSDAAPERVLVVGAHPDDAEFFAGATLAQWAMQGARVAVVVCTDGARGGFGNLDVAAVRAKEQERAAALLGFASVSNLGCPDGALRDDDAVRAELVLALRSERPEVVLGHDPRTLWTPRGARVDLGHSDHRAAGEALLAAVYPRALSPSFCPEQLAGGALRAWFPRELWLFDSAAPDHFVDAGAGFARKLEALRAHASQNRGEALVDAAREAAGDPPRESFVRLRLRA
jgi:LmbE family N-acetylglucosaminyl deacetylase